MCPRKCNIDRKVQRGFCGAPENAVVSLAMLHKWEEPILTGEKGLSGAIFFSSCNLRCAYCQNYKISHEACGKVLSTDDLIKLFKKLEDMGAENIDLVTPTHYSLQILEALKQYKPKVPVIWNTSGYESVQTLKALEGYVDIFLTDYKYFSSEFAKKYSMAEDYPDVIISALKEMKRQQPENVFEGGKLIKGIVVRHLVLPSLVRDSKNVLSSIKDILSDCAIVSILRQYVPMGNAAAFPEINRKITPLEYKIVTNYALKLGLNNSLVQDSECASEEYTPDFDNVLFDI